MAENEKGGGRKRVRREKVMAAAGEESIRRRERKLYQRCHARCMKYENERKRRENGYNAIAINNATRALYHMKI